MELSGYFLDPSTRVPASIIIFIASLLGAKIVIDLFRKGNLPPGPRGVPFLGFLPFFGKFPHLTFMKLREKFGDIIGIQMGSFPAIVIHGKNLIKEVFVTRGDDFSGRPNFYSRTLLGKESMTLGIFSEVTILHKRMASNVLYVFSNARKNPLEDIVSYEAKMAVSEFAAMNGEPFHPRPMILTSVGSIIFQICYGQERNIRAEDKYFADFLATSTGVSEFNAAGNPVDVMPYLRFIMPWKVSQIKNLLRRLKDINNLKISENMKNFTPGHTKHLTDGLIAAYKEEQQKPNSPFTEERIFSTLTDIVGAGFETITTGLSWIIWCLVKFPEVQEKVHQEIDSILGKRQPMLSDKADMHYCMATINEAFRFTSFIPLGIPHAATRDTELRGYTICKGTVIIPNMHSISHDPEIWGDPDVFRPERYLDAEGHLDKTITEKFNIFSMGRRKCLGEFLARAETFLFFTGIFQLVKFTLPVGTKDFPFEYSFGLLKTPTPFQVCCELRD